MRNKRFTATVQVEKGSGYLTDLFVTSSANDGHATVYDGESTDGDIIADVRVGDNFTANFSPKTWPEFTRGLHLVIAGTNTSVNIGFRHK